MMTRETDEEPIDKGQQEGGEGSNPPPSSRMSARGRSKPPSRTTRTKVPKKGDTSALEQPKRSRGVKFDWPTIMAAFVEGFQIDGEEEDHRVFPTMKELAERYNVGYQTVRERAARERWTQRRDEFQMQVVLDRQKKRSQSLAKNSAAFDERAYKAADMGAMLVQSRLAEIAQEFQARRKDREAMMEALKAGHPVEKKDLHSAIYHRELEGLASALDRFQTIGMKALGTDVQKVELTGEVGETITVNVNHELTRDDPERTASVIAALADAGQLPQELVLALAGSPEDDDIIDAEVVEPEEEGDPAS